METKTTKKRKATPSPTFKVESRDGKYMITSDSGFTHPIPNFYQLQTRLYSRRYLPPYDYEETDYEIKNVETIKLLKGFLPFIQTGRYFGNAKPIYICYDIFAGRWRTGDRMKAFRETEKKLLVLEKEYMTKRQKTFEQRLARVEAFVDHFAERPMVEKEYEELGRVAASSISSSSSVNHK